MLNKKTLQKIKKLGIETDWNSAFGGKSKGNRHLIRMVAISTWLAGKTGADVRIVEAAAFLHDSALPTGNDYDYEKNKKVVKKLLKNITLSKSDLDRIAECVASHEGTVMPKTLEAKIIHDADVIEKSGMLGVIRHTWKLTNSSAKKVINAQEVLQHILWREKRLQLPISKKLVRRLNGNLKISRLKDLVPRIGKLASEAIVTEKIIVMLRDSFTTAENRDLQQQVKLLRLENL
ncbi:MAG: HD domain-containing protein [bacterium]|nr:HD domain-containing protein [bacterium]